MRKIEVLTIEYTLLLVCFLSSFNCQPLNLVQCLPSNESIHDKFSWGSDVCQNSFELYNTFSRTANKFFFKYGLILVPETQSAIKDKK